MNAEIIPGIQYTWNVPVRPKFLYNRNTGIIPPLTYIVITQKRDNCDLKRNLLRLTTNASNALATSDVTVAMTVLATVTLAPTQMFCIANTVL